MELEYYGKPSKNKGSKKKHLIIFAVVTFSLILFWLIYSSIYGEISLTGGIIGKAVNLNDDSNIKLDAKLTIPSLGLDGKFKRIEISGRSDSYLNVYCDNHRNFRKRIKQIRIWSSFGIFSSINIFYRNS